MDMTRGSYRRSLFGWALPVSPASVFLVVLSVLAFPFTAQATTKKPPAAPVNINTASETELQRVPGIGPAFAKRIVAMRRNAGPFKSVDDLRAVEGIGKKRLDKMRPYLTVGKPGGVKKGTTATPDKPAQPTTETSPPSKP